MVESGVVINGHYTPVPPLSTPSKIVTLSNVSPFISDEVLVGELVSPMKKFAIASKSFILKRSMKK